ncbi:MAG: hypothetical protein D8B56_06390, partial [Alloprevotella sp.]
SVHPSTASSSPPLAASAPILFRNIPEEEGLFSKGQMAGKRPYLFIYSLLNREISHYLSTLTWI